jgi:hypothetical protein
MRRLGRALLILLALAAATLAVAVLILMPPGPATTAAPSWSATWPTVRGAYHIHSSRSDGTGSVDDIAAAAARAGLQFVVLTDHGDGTRAPDPPSYRSGVLCLDGIEVSTSHGHYVALGLPQLPYRLGGHPRAVIEDVQRFGGFGFAAHPDSRKPALRWSDWTVPVDGVEWLNGDSEWRDESWTSLARVLLTYGFRPQETLVTLIDRPVDMLSRWDRLARVRHITGIAAADAHARLSLRETSEPYTDRVITRLPSYDASFRAFSNHAILDAPLSGDAARDAASVLTAIREGRMYSAIDGFATHGALEVKALAGSEVARPGEYLQSAEPIVIEASLAAPSGTSLVVLRDGQAIFDAVTGSARVAVGSSPAAYRVEARLPNRSGGQAVPWLLTNPIYVNLRSAHSPPVSQQPAEPAERTPIATQDVSTESSTDSTSLVAPAVLKTGVPVISWRLALADGRDGSQFAAISLPSGSSLSAHTGLQIRARADRQMRIWAQLRVPESHGLRRWSNSFVVGPDLQTVDLKFADFLAVGEESSSEPPPLDDIDRVLLVVDTVNAVPGTTATVSVANVWLTR